jgi:hypothetical protein
MIWYCLAGFAVIACFPVRGNVLASRHKRSTLTLQQIIDDAEESISMGYVKDNSETVMIGSGVGTRFNILCTQTQICSPETITLPLRYIPASVPPSSFGTTKAAFGRNTWLFSMVSFIFNQ